MTPPANMLPKRRMDKLINGANKPTIFGITNGNKGSKKPLI